jgi:hypothetical protein
MRWNEMKKLIIVALCVLAIGCQRADMEDKVQPGKTTIMTDAHGNKYAVTYHSGSLYRIQPIKEAD